MTKTVVKTPIVYYGGKTAILSHLMEMVPLHEVYTETFFGGGTLFWSKDPARNETINDRLDVVVNFYRQLKCNFRIHSKTERGNLRTCSLLELKMPISKTQML